MQGVNYKHTAQSLQEWTRYLFPDELDELKRLANLLPNNPLVINFGAGNGTSAFCFMEAREDLSLVTIDITKDSSPFGCLEAERKHLEAAGYWDTRNIEHIQASSSDVGKDWQSIMDRPLVDMVFVDGEHVAPQPTLDIKAWLPNIKPGGIMAVHDYKKGDLAMPQPENVPQLHPWPDVDKAVDKLLKPNYEQIGLVDSLISFRIRRLQ